MTTEYEAVLKSDQLRSQYDLFLGVRLCLKYKSLIKKQKLKTPQFLSSLFGAMLWLWYIDHGREAAASHGNVFYLLTQQVRHVYCLRLAVF